MAHDIQYIVGLLLTTILTVFIIFFIFFIQRLERNLVF